MADPVAVRMLRDGDQRILLDPAPDPFDNPVDPAASGECRADPHNHTAGAIDGFRLGGFVSAVEYWHPRELFINETGVAAGHRRGGLGLRLLRTLFDNGRGRCCVDAWVLTEPGNLAANALYARAGGIRDGTNPVMYTFDLAPRPI